jgi:hypothetical protein
MSESLISLKTRLTQYIACEKAITLGAQQYEVEGKMFRRANLSEVRKAITKLQNDIKAKTPATKTIRSQNIFHRRH